MADAKSEIWFYQLERTSLEETLPGLLERVLGAGWRAVVRAGSDARLDALDSRLWTYKDDAFLAHGRAGREHSEDQPIYLTTGDENPNGAEALVIVDNADFTELTNGKTGDYTRTMILFSGADEGALTAAREMWKTAKAADLDIAYWAQNASGGGWEKKA